MKNYGLLILFILSIKFVNAQKNTLTLQDCINTGIQNNLKLKIEKLTALQAKKQKRSYLNSLLPQVNGFGSHQYNFGSTIDPNTNSRVSRNFLQDNFSLRANSELINFENIYNSKNLTLNFEKAKANQKLIEYKYISEITSAFFNTLFTQELLKLQQKQLENTSKNLERITNEVQIGNKPKSELYDITLNYTQEEKKVLKAQQQLEIQLQELANLINETTDFSNKKLVNNTSNLIQINTVNNPEIKVTSLKRDISVSKYKMIKSKLLPTISLFYNISSFYYKPINSFSNTSVNNFSTQLKNNKNQQIGLQLSFILFDGFRRNKNIAEAKIEKEKQDLALENTKNQIHQKIKLEKLKEQQLTTLQNQLQTVYKNAKNSFKTSQAKFESGKIELQVFNLTKNQLLTAEFDVLKNQLELEWVREKIQQLCGN